MAQPRIGFLAVGFGCLYEAVKLGTVRRAVGRVAEQPVLSSGHEGPDGAFGWDIVDRQIAFLDISLEFVPVVGQIGYGLAQCVLRCDIGERLSTQAFSSLITWQLKS